MAYNTKLYRSTGSAWEEVRVGSEWGMIANKPTNFPPTSHTHPDYLPLAGGTLNGSLSITTTNFPVVDIVRNTGSTGSGIYGGARLRRVTSNPQAGVGIGVYFSAPNASGTNKSAGMVGACLTNIASGAEVGQLKFTPAWQGRDDKTVMTLTATGLNQGRLALNGDFEATGSIKINGNNVLTGVTNSLNINGETVGFYSATSQTTKAVYAATSQLSTSTAKRYLIGTQSTTSLAVQNCNTNVYMQNGKIYSAPTSDSDSDNTVATKSYVDSKPPTSHTHPEYVKTSGNQTITGIKQIDNSDLRMNGGSVSYLRPATTGGWARGFWWQKNATDDVPYQRIGGIGVLGNNLSVSKFYIGYGESPWTNSILEAFPDYVNINGTLRTIATTDASSDTTVTTKAYVLGKCLGKTETAANSAKLGGQLPSYYASKSDVPVITYSNGTLTITTG